MEKRTKRIRIKKDFFLKGKHSIHATEYLNGKIVYDSVLNFFTGKKQAEKFRKDYKAGREVKFAYPNCSYKEFISK